MAGVLVLLVESMLVPLLAISSVFASSVELSWLLVNTLTCSGDCTDLGSFCSPSIMAIASAE